jgi:hypothetical protein
VRYFVGLFVLLFAAMSACDETTEPTCTPENDCAAPADGGSIPDGAVQTSTDDGAPPPPFDAGVVSPQPTCKGLFELCSFQECCSPYGCTNGTCR